jgi:hypothetical protein
VNILDCLRAESGVIPRPAFAADLRPTCRQADWQPRLRVIDLSLRGDWGPQERSSHEHTEAT